MARPGRLLPGLTLLLAPLLLTSALWVVSATSGSRAHALRASADQVTSLGTVTPADEALTEHGAAHPATAQLGMELPVRAAWYGVLTVLAAYHLLLFAMLREPGRAQLAGASAATLAVEWLSHAGDQSPGAADHTYLAASALLIASGMWPLFSRVALEIQRHDPSLDRLLRRLGRAALVAGCALPLVGWLAPTASIAFALASCCVSLALCLGTGLRILRANFAPARLFLIAHGTLLGCAVLYGLLMLWMGDMDSATGARLAIVPRLGMASQLLLFGLVLAQRSSCLRSETEAARDEARRRERETQDALEQVIVVSQEVEGARTRAEQACKQVEEVRSEAQRQSQEVLLSQLKAGEEHALAEKSRIEAECARVETEKTLDEAQKAQFDTELARLEAEAARKDTEREHQHALRAQLQAGEDHAVAEQARAEAQRARIKVEMALETLKDSQAQTELARQKAEEARRETEREHQHALRAQLRASEEHAIAERAKAEAEKARKQAENSLEQIRQAHEETEVARREAEEAYQRIETMDRQKTLFFQNISHELRTPLTLLLNPLEHATRNHPSDGSLKVADRNARRLLRLVNQLLDFQKLSAGQKTLVMEAVDLVRFAWVCSAYVRDTCAGKDIAFRVSLDGQEVQESDLGTLTCFIHGEIDALEKIVFNYLSNALKFTPPGGRIQLDLTTEGEHIDIAVSDTGPGIRDEDLGKLFQLFSQVDGSSTREVEGTGLGLALARDLTEVMKGEVGVSSQLGHGSRFWSRFPTIPSPAEGEGQANLEGFEVKHWLLADQQGNRDAEDIAHLKEAAIPENRDEWPRILVVDDLSDMRRLIADTLERNGYQPVLATDGFDGLEKARADPPDLIITDWMMRRKSGLDLIGDLRADQTLKHLPIVLLTARSDEEAKILGTEVGADAFLGKPFNEQELCATVRNLLALKANEKEISKLATRLREGVLERYLPPDLVDAIICGEQQVSVQPEPRTVTVMFADLCGFTRSTQELGASKMATLLNEYLAAMTQVVFAHGGTIDKFVGDAVMVMFGAPTCMDGPEQARRAAACALQMQEELTKLTRSWSTRGLPRIEMRIGMHQGPVVVGNFGSERRMDYTAIGHTVNLAARVEGVCTPGQVFLTYEMVDYLPADVCEPRGEFELKGVRKTVTLFRVLPEAAARIRDSAA